MKFVWSNLIPFDEEIIVQYLKKKTINIGHKLIIINGQTT
jgi:hypothetical protein